MCKKCAHLGQPERGRPLIRTLYFLKVNRRVLSQIAVYLEIHFHKHLFLQCFKKLKFLKNAICDRALIPTVLIFATVSAWAENTYIENLSIKKIRAVGDFTGPTYDNTIEIWFTSPVAWPAPSTCTITDRVYVDAANKHIISMAYIALTTGKKININADDLLVKRGGACELSYLDVTN